METNKIQEHIHTHEYIFYWKKENITCCENESDAPSYMNTT